MTVSSETGEYGWNEETKVVWCMPMQLGPAVVVTLTNVAENKWRPAAYYEEGPWIWSGRITEKDVAQDACTRLIEYYEDFINKISYL